MSEWIAHPPMWLLGLATVAGAVAMLAWRAREGRRAVTLRSIVAPPLGMSTGFAMFAAPATRVPVTWAVAALALGAVAFAIPLVRTSRLVRVGAGIQVERSRAFVAILLALVAVRFGLRTWLEAYVSPLQTGALFYLLAFGAVVRWRVAMWREYRALVGDQRRSDSTGLYSAVRPAM